MEVLCGGDYRRKKKKRHFFLSPSSAFVWANQSLTVWQAWIIVEFQDGDLIFWRLQLVLLCFDPAFGSSKHSHEYRMCKGCESLLPGHLTFKLTQPITTSKACRPSPYSLQP
jgi:hypothetical protein